jgi:hypothetical protein
MIKIKLKKLIILSKENCTVDNIFKKKLSVIPFHGLILKRDLQMSLL